ncbi:MAG TPA: WhiB family transcriptional regulator [Egibacteraceae bacterium]|jgi:WhiB family transcriptional regulator, redox-sensing transcriptional regulator|nr:WhiB family transcriptional regulator [Egibacteraceae bacterium]
MSMPDRSWQERAACRERDAEVFFCVEPQAVEFALSVCATCAVREPCLAQAMATREVFGVWGGTTETQRRRIFRRERRERRRDTAA